MQSPSAPNVSTDNTVLPDFPTHLHWFFSVSIQWFWFHIRWINDLFFDPEFAQVLPRVSTRIPGNVAFRAPSGNSEASEVETETGTLGLDAAAMLLGLEAKSLADACCKRTMQAPGMAIAWNILKFSADSLGREFGGSGYLVRYRHVLTQYARIKRDSLGADWYITRHWTTKPSELHYSFRWRRHHDAKLSGEGIG